MIAFTQEIHACWLLEGYTNVVFRPYPKYHYATLTPSREEMPVDMQLFFKVLVYPINSEVISDMFVPAKDGFKIFVGESYDHYRNFDPEHIDDEADF